MSRSNLSDTVTGTGNIYCAYCGVLHDPGIETSLEHVIPFALGGSDKLTVVTCKRGNNDLGSAVDAPFIDFFPVSTRRFFLGLESTSGNEPSVDLGGKGWIAGREVRISHLITGESHEAKIAKPTIVKKQADGSEEWQISGDPRMVAEILQGKLRKQTMLEKTITLKSGETLTLEGIEQLIAEATVETIDPSVVKTLQFDYLVSIRFFCKLALAMGHLHFGRTFSSSTYAERLRRAMRAKSVGDVDLPGAAIWPETTTVKPLLQQFAKRNEHTLVILDGTPPILLVSLFGEFDAVLPTDELPSVGPPAVTGTGTVWRVELPSRRLTTCSVVEYISMLRQTAPSGGEK